MSTDEAFTERVLGPLSFELQYELRKANDCRQPEEIIAMLVRNWLQDRRGTPFAKGYQWKDLFLPHGTELRLRFKGKDYYATIQGDKLMYGGGHMTPREWCRVVTGTVRNPWRDIWIRRNSHEYWLHAWQWRKDNSVLPPLWGCDRRCLARRKGDSPAP